MRQFIYNAGILAVIFATAITVTTCLLCRSILTWMGTPQEILDDAVAYLIVIFAGIPFTFLYNILAGIIRSLGDSRTPFFFLIISTILNILGDLLFILVFHTGVMGAALATVLAQAISGILCLFYMIKHFPILKMHREECRFMLSRARKLIVIGVPMGLQFSITAIGSIMLQSAVNGLGTTAVAAYAAAMKIKMLAMCPFDALANAMATFAGQNLGARKLERIRRGVRASLITGGIYGIMAAVLLHLGGRMLTMLFVEASQTAVLDMSAQYLATIGTFYFVLAFLNVLRMTIQGIGYSIPAFFAGIFEMLARTGMALFVIPVYGYTAACFTDVTAWVAATLFLIPLFFGVMRRLEVKQQQSAMNR